MSLKIEEQRSMTEASPCVQTDSPRRSGMARIFSSALKALPCSHPLSPARTSRSCFGRSGSQANTAQPLESHGRMSQFRACCFGGCGGSRSGFHHPNGSEVPASQSQMQNVPNAHIGQGSSHDGHNEIQPDHSSGDGTGTAQELGHSEIQPDHSSGDGTSTAQGSGHSEIQPDHSSGDGTYTAQGSGHSEIQPDHSHVVLAELRDANNKRVLSLPNPKDPLVKLEKKREKLSEFLLVFNGLTGLSTMMNPPGRLDSKGLIHFRHKITFKWFHFFTESMFIISTINYTILSKELDEDQSYEEKIRTLKRKLLVCWIIIWVTGFLYLGVYVTGFWLIYPSHELVEPTDTTVKMEIYHPSHDAWPRYTTLDAFIFKFIFVFLYYFG